MDKIIPFLETYKGRDRLLRLLSYFSKLIAGSTNLRQFDNLSSQISSARTCFRLLDDLPTLLGVLNYKQKNEGYFNQFISLLECFVDVIFCPIDHIAWAIDHEIILAKTTAWDTACTSLWVISLYINIYNIVLKMAQISKLKIQNKGIADRETERKLSLQQWQLELNAIKCIADIIFAVNYLPAGTLWARTLQKWQVGALGSISSVVSLYQALCM